MKNKPWSKKSDKERVEKILEVFDKPHLKTQLVDRAYMEGYNTGIQEVVVGIKAVLRDWEEG